MNGTITRTTTKNSSKSVYRRTSQAAQWLLGRVQSSLLAALLIYKLLTVWLFVPLIQWIWAVALRYSPTRYITTDNLSSLLRSPFLAAAILLIGICTAWWALYEFSLILCGLDYAHHGQRCRLLPLLTRAGKSIAHAMLPKNWGVLLYAAVLIPFTNVFLSSNYISQLAVPEYIAEVIHSNLVGHITYTLVFVALCALALCWMLCLHYFVLEGKSFREAHKAAFAWIRQQPLQKIYMLLRWSVRLVCKGLLILALPTILLLSVLIAAGLYSNILMLALWRSFLMVLLPFVTYLLDCLLTLSGEAFLSALYYAQPDGAPLNLERRLPNGKRYRKGGRFFLFSVWLLMLLAWALVGLVVAIVPDADDLLLSYFMPPITVTSHRGYSAVAPENTLPAFEAAIHAGADCAELDVQMTSDGVVMLTHDTNLKRTTGMDANIYDLTYDEVRTLDAGAFMSSEFAGTKIPTLQEVMDLCKGRIRLNIEIKPSDATPDLEAETARLIVENGWIDDCVVTSLSYDSLVKVKETAPQIKCGYIMAVGVGNYYDLPAADFFSVESTFITSGMVQQLHLRGKTVSAWTIDREEDARKMRDLGVDDIITGDPPMVQQVLAEASENEHLLESVRDYFYLFFPHRDDPFISVQTLLRES